MSWTRIEYYYEELYFHTYSEIVALLAIIGDYLCSNRYVPLSLGGRDNTSVVAVTINRREELRKRCPPPDT